MMTSMVSQDCNLESEHSDPLETTALLPDIDCVKATRDSHFQRIEESRFWWLFGCIMFASLIAFFDSTIMASSHPVITSYFKSSNSASWLSTVFLLSSTVSQPLYGRISDIVGRRSVFIFSLFVFFINIAGCAAAPNIGIFIISRAVCGVGAGGITTMTIIMISDVVKLEYRGIYQSYFNIAWGCGNGLGAALGGLLCDRLGWRAAFYLQLPFIFSIGVIASIVTPSDLGPHLAKSEGKSTLEALRQFDILGAITLTITVASFILGINLGGNVLEWTHPIVLISLGLFLVSLCVLLVVEGGARRPILPLSLLSSFPMANLIWANLLSAMVLNNALFNIPLFLQAVRQVSPTTSGLYLIGPLVGAAVAGTFSGFWITWTRKIKPLIVIGAVCILVGTVSLTCLNSAMPSWAIALLIPIASIGQGLNWPPTSIAVLALGAQDKQAVLSTTLGLLRSIGSIVGIATSSLIFQNALIAFLDQYVTDSSELVRKQIMLAVRENVSAISTLNLKHRGQVIQAYTHALRITFASSIAVAVLCIFITLPVRLPVLGNKSDYGESENDNVPSRFNDLESSPANEG